MTLPLILPALLAGLIFSFTRHMTSLSAIIFLVSARWRIVTASILSEWEQGGVSIAAAYSTVIIVLVLIAIGVLYFLTGRMLRGRGGIDMTWGSVRERELCTCVLENLVKTFPPAAAWAK